ncbi:hypothetical protein BpHYR1_053828 [Brachionus plicatilis]|uniref:Uncharacterized protein n=1 Tax=Brachionus plicatilis TaxID=10195 RepID=A0A3M7R4K5_BRAPC|nr:hypothetical protein BpHYR1_053828 [Brachionus plicatilis]
MKNGLKFKSVRQKLKVLELRSQLRVKERVVHVLVKNRSLTWTYEEKKLDLDFLLITWTSIWDFNHNEHSIINL